MTGRRPRPARPVCCDHGAVSPLGACPAHDSWRHLLFVQPPARPDIDDDDLEEQPA